MNSTWIRPSKCYRNEENDGFVKSWQKYDNDNVNVIFLWTERGATVSFCMTEYKLMTCYCYFFFDSDKAIGLPWCNIGHFHCYCYIFLTEKMVMWQYFWQTLCYCDIILDSLLLSLQYFLTLEVLSWQMWDISIAIVIFFWRSWW